MKVMRNFNNTSMAGHQIFSRHTRRNEKGLWKGLKNKVLKYVQQCFTCQQNKNGHTYPTSLLQPIPIPSKKWENIWMDFIIELPRVQGEDCIYFLDSLTDFGHTSLSQQCLQQGGRFVFQRDIQIAWVAQEHNQ